MKRELSWLVAAGTLATTVDVSAQTGSTSDATSATTSSAPMITASTTQGTSAGQAADASVQDDAGAQENDHERNRHFWIDLAVGYSYINLIKLNQDNFVPQADVHSSSGIVVEGGLGFRVSVLRMGVAGSYAQYSGYDVGTAELDLALVIPTPLIEPYIEAGIGYGWIGNVDVASGSGAVTAPIHGIAVDVGLGLDLNLSDAVQLGIGVDASFLNLQRQRVTALGTIANVDFRQTGTALGIQVNGTGRITFQF